MALPKGDPLEEEVRRHVTVTTWNALIREVEGFASWGRRSSIWPLSSGLACCAIEMICAAASRFDIARFGAEMFRPSPRQADLMIISGTVTKKMAPVLVRLWNQMSEPKYCLSMGACANGGGPFKEGYTVVSGVDEFIPVDVYVRGCPPTPDSLLQGLISIQKKIDADPFIGRWRFGKRAEIPVPILGPDLVDTRQADEISAIMARGEEQRIVAPKAKPEARPAAKAVEAGSSEAAAPVKGVAAKLAARFGPENVRIHGAESLVIAPSVWGDAARVLHDEFGYDYLANLAGADYSDCREVAYHLVGVEKAVPRLSVKVRCDRDGGEVPSVTGVWKGASLQEREAWDLFGIKFAGHPNLKRILTWEGFAGHPLRKDWLEPYYEEPAKVFSSRWRDGRHVPSEERNRWHRNVIYPAGAAIPREAADDTAIEDGSGMTLSLGPQHPSTHGVFQIKVGLDGERVRSLESVFGYLHRCHDKIGERNTWLMNIPYTDRLDYFTSMANNLAYVSTVERLAGIKVTERAEYIRVIMVELTRIVNHLVAIGFQLNELGAWFTPLLYALEERELILDLFEEVSGSRMMCNYMRFSGVARDLPPGWLGQARKLVSERLPRAIDELDTYLTRNEIIGSRLRGIGVLPRDLAINASAAGPILRASGVKYDIRKAEPYSIYDRFEFDVPVLPQGDAYARYLIKLAEMRQSLRILSQALKQVPDAGPFVEKNQHLLRVPEGEWYGRFENPKGELGFWLVSSGGGNPYRYHVRAPSFINLTALEEMCKGHTLADVVVIFGSLDVVMGEVDR